MEQKKWKKRGQKQQNISELLRRITINVNCKQFDRRKLKGATKKDSLKGNQKARGASSLQFHSHISMVVPGSPSQRFEKKKREGSCSIKGEPFLLVVVLEGSGGAWQSSVHWPWRQWFAKTPPKQQPQRQPIQQQNQKNSRRIEEWSDHRTMMTSAKRR